MEELLHDIRYGLRMLVKRPGLTAVAVIALALGIGANTAIFSVVDSVLLRALPFEEPERLVALWSTRAGSDLERGTMAYPDFREWDEHMASFEQVGVYAHTARTLRLAGAEPVQLNGVLASTDLLPLLGVEPALGRVFTEEENRPGAPDVVVLSHGAWQRFFAGDPAVVGSSVQLGNDGATVVGVMPEGFAFPVQSGRTDFWVPSLPTIGETAEQRGSQFLMAAARLRPGVSIQQAQTEMDALMARLAEQYSDSNTGRGTRILAMHEDVVGDTRPALLVLFGAVGFVLLIACANVANLLLARAAARQKEIVIRSALGASRWRVMRQLLTESVILTLVGGALGLLLAAWGLDILLQFAPGRIPRLRDAGLDGRVLAFTGAVCLLTSLFAGLAPALQASKADLNTTLKDAARGSTEGARANRLRSGLVVLEVALSIMLLVGAGLLVKSFLSLSNVDPGFDATGVVTTELLPSRTRYPDADDRSRYFERALETIRQTPGVESAAVVSPLPFSGSRTGVTFTIEGRPQPAPGNEPAADIRTVSPDYFRTMREPVVAGREFTDRDTKDAPQVVVVNESFVRTHFPGEEPLGKRIVIGADPTDNPNPPAREIVGVVADARHLGLDRPPVTEYYVPYLQEEQPTFEVVARTGMAEGGTVGPAVREAILSLDRDQYVPRARPMTELLEISLARQRFNTLLLGIFSAVALLLTTMGLYGVMSYSVSRRTQEIGVRMALGAQTRDVLALVVGQGMGLTVVGLAVGLLGALALTRFVESLLFGVTATDPATFLAVAALLLGVALVACYVPARRAARVDPLVALRYE